jgi:hypothetical protein
VTSLCVSADKLPAGFPQITQAPSTKVVEIGHNAVLLCSAVGTPAPRISWVRDMLPVDPSKNPRYTILDTAAGMPGMCHYLSLWWYNPITQAQGDSLCGLVFRVPGYRSRGPGFDSWRYQIFWEVVGLERGPLSLVSTTGELLGRNNNGFGLEYGGRDPFRWPRDTLYPQKLTLTSLTNGGRSIDIVWSRTQATEFSLV